MENDDLLLPAITIVETGPYITQFWRIVVDAYWRTATGSDDSAFGSEIEAVHTTLQGAIDDATQYLYNFVAADYQHPSGHILLDLPRNRPTRRSQKRLVYEVAISLSQAAWDHFRSETRRLHYDGNGGFTNTVGGTNAYLAALIRANPGPGHWTDTRPDYLVEVDQERMAADPPQLPLWYLYDSSDDYRRGRLLNRANWETLLQPHLLEISNHFLILPSNNITKERSRASAALEAIGLQYLTPTNPVEFNPHPPKKYSGWHDRHRSRQTGRTSWELSF